MAWNNTDEINFTMNKTQIRNNRETKLMNKNEQRGNENGVN